MHSSSARHALSKSNTCPIPSNSSHAMWVIPFNIRSNDLHHSGLYGLSAISFPLLNHAFFSVAKFLSFFLPSAPYNPSLTCETSSSLCKQTALGWNSAFTNPTNLLAVEVFKRCVLNLGACCSGWLYRRAVTGWLITSYLMSKIRNADISLTSCLVYKFATDQHTKLAQASIWTRYTW